MIASCLKSDFLLGVSAALLCLAATGCESKGTSDYVPQANQARQAVEQMLEAWRAGDVAQATLRLPDGGPAVQVFDKERSSGKKLASAEVVREIPVEPNEPRQIAVKLVFQGEDKEVEAIYYVVGIDPLLVFRDSEYRQASGMN